METNYKTMRRYIYGYPAPKVIHRDMKIRRSDFTRQECLEVGMSPAQKEVFMAKDEWWKRYGCGRSPLQGVLRESNQ